MIGVVKGHATPCQTKVEKSTCYRKYSAMSCVAAEMTMHRACHLMIGAVQGMLRLAELLLGTGQLASCLITQVLS